MRSTPHASLHILLNPCVAGIWKNIYCSPTSQSWWQLLKSHLSHSNIYCQLPTPLPERRPHPSCAPNSTNCRCTRSAASSRGPDEYSGSKQPERNAADKISSRISWRTNLTPSWYLRAQAQRLGASGTPLILKAPMSCSHLPALSLSPFQSFP